MRATGLKESESAVSEVVDFIIIFGVMLMSVSMIVVYGYPIVDHMQDMNHMENVRQSFVVLKSNLNKVVFGEAPSQSVELKLYGGSLSVTGSSTINISCQVWNQTSASLETRSFDRQTRMIETEYEDISFSYENTGVWAQYPTGDAIMVSKPQFSSNDAKLIIPISLIAGSSSTGGSGLVSIVAEGGEANLHKYQNVSEVDIDITSDYYKGWGRYLNESLGMSVSTDDVNKSAYGQKQYSENIDVHIIYSPMTTIIE